MAVAPPQFVYYNFLTGTTLISDDVLTALRTKVDPSEGSVRFSESDPWTHHPSDWPPHFWALLEFKRAPSDIGTQTVLRREAEFLRSIGYGLDVAGNRSEGRMLVSKEIVKELYGPSSPGGKEALFQFPVVGGIPAEGRIPATIPDAKIAAMIAFLEAKVVPLFVAQAHKQMKGLPETVRAGADLRRELQQLEYLQRDLRSLVGNSASTVGKPV